MAIKTGFSNNKSYLSENYSEEARLKPAMYSKQTEETPQFESD